MKKLEEKLSELDAKIRLLVLDEIAMLMEKHSIDVSQLNGKRRVGRPAKAATTAVKPTKKRHNRPRGPQPPKYRDPKTGATWTGLARPPSWIKGKDYSRFAI